MKAALFGARTAPLICLDFFSWMVFVVPCPGMGPHPHSPLKLGRKSPEAAWLLGGEQEAEGRKRRVMTQGLGMEAHLGGGGLGLLLEPYPGERQ